MALIIKGNMPPSCRWHNKQGENTPIEVCPYFQNCSAEFNFEDYRPSDCPILGEIPDEHGDLIERSKVHEAIAQAYCLEDVPSIIDQLVPTVLEAST